MSLLLNIVLRTSHETTAYVLHARSLNTLPHVASVPLSSFSKTKYYNCDSLSTVCCRNVRRTVFEVQTLRTSNARLLCVPGVGNNQIRHFSAPSWVESFAYTHASWFKSLSESTPVAYSQDLFQFIHDCTGFSWWASIILTTVMARTMITLPVTLYQNYIIAKLENLKLEMPAIVAELKKETVIAMKMFNWTEKEARIMYNHSLKKQYRLLIERDNCHPMKTTILLWVQLPMWVCFSVALRNMVYMFPVQDTAAQILNWQLSVGGFLWVPNLTIPDASWIMPVLLGVVNLAIIEIQTMSKVKEPTKVQKYATNFFRVLSIAMIPISASVPSCLCVYWLTSSIFGLAQNLALMSPKVKRFSRIPQTPGEKANPYKHMAAAIRARAEYLTSWRRIEK